MNSKILLLSIAVISVGLFAMPTTLSLFAGQHTFDKGANVTCQKCHQDIYDEMGGSGLYGTSTAHTSSTLKVCTACHKAGTIGGIPKNKTDLNATGGSGSFTQNLTTAGAHAAVTMECVGCHTGVPAELLNSSEAHGDFYNASLAQGTNSTQSGILKGANIACVGCHTHTDVRGTWRRSVGYNMTVNETTTGAYNITFAVNTSTNTTTTFGGNVTSP